MKEILEYLSALEQHNNRDWYHANKAQYQSANKMFLEIIQDLIIRIGSFDPAILHNNPSELTFRLTRDTRFSHDKSPYNPSFRAHMAAGGKLPVPVGYYIVIRPGDRSFLGGGLFADMFKEATAMVRDAVAKDGDEWERIISDAAFREYFRVKGSALKNVPRGYDPGHPQAEYLKHKSWYLECPITDEQLLQDDFVERAAGIFAAVQPFNRFLNHALAAFEMPGRP